jgi:hypothetical protein
MSPPARRHTHRRRAALSAAAAALAVTVAGCSSPAGQRERDLASLRARPPACSTRTPHTASAGYQDTNTPDLTLAQFQHTFPGTITPPPARSQLMGPHSFLQLMATATFSALPGKAACALRMYRRVQAATGYQLIVALLSDSTSLPDVALPECQGNNITSGDGPLACQDYPPPTIVTGKTSQPLQQDGPGNVFIVSVADKATPELQMNDGGRAQDISLRTGLRTHAASPLYYPVPSWTWNGQINTDWDTSHIPSLRWWPEPLDGELNGGYAVLTPYADGRGWAPPGRAWLILLFGMPSPAPQGWTMDYNLARSLTVSLPDGTRLPGRGTDTWNSPDYNVYITVEVPASTRSATVLWTPTGRIYQPKDYDEPSAELPPAQSAGKIAVRLSD